MGYHSITINLLQAAARGRSKGPLVRLDVPVNFEQEAVDPFDSLTSLSAGIYPDRSGVNKSQIPMVEIRNGGCGHPPYEEAPPTTVGGWLGGKQISVDGAVKIIT